MSGAGGLADFALADPSLADTYAREHMPEPGLLPELLFELPSLQYPARLNCVAELLDRPLLEQRIDGARSALRGAFGDWSYAHLQLQVDRIAAVLRLDLGLVSGNRVLLRGANTPMMAACILSVIKAGCIAVPTMPLLRARELAPMLARARIDAVLCADDLRAVLAELPGLPPTLYFGASEPGALDPSVASLDALMARHAGGFAAHNTAADDICLISFTSGTTGMPKATMHGQRDLLAVCDCFARALLGTRADDIFIGTPPLGFTFGLGALLLFGLRAGACTVLLEKPTPASLLQAIDTYRATLCFTAPTLYRQMAPLVAGHDLASLRCCVSAGEALPQATRDSWLAASRLELVDGLGSSELLHIVIASAPGQARRGAIGQPVPGYRACILGGDGRPAGPGVVGRLALKGPTGCRYLADARQAEYVHDGWNITGDVGLMDGDGYFYYRGRSDDMIISAGYNIAGAEVEDALLRHPAVAECAVVGRRDSERGQVVEAHVVLNHGYAAGAALAVLLQQFVKAEIAPYKYPRAIRFLAALPRTESGKLQRYKLRAEQA